MQHAVLFMHITKHCDKYTGRKTRVFLEIHKMHSGGFHRESGERKSPVESRGRTLVGGQKLKHFCKCKSKIIACH